MGNTMLEAQQILKKDCNNINKVRVAQSLPKATCLSN